MTKENVFNDYHEEIAFLDEEEKKLKQQSFYLSVLRLAVFLLTIGFIVFLSSKGILLTLGCGFVGLFVFLNVIKHHHRKDQKRRMVNVRQSIINNELSALDNYKNDNYDGSKFIDQEHNYSSDLDVFGPFSLFALINRCRTYDGITCLNQYLSSLPSLELLEQRTKVIKELESDKKWRIDFLSSLHEIKDGVHRNITDVVSEILDSDLSFATMPILSIYRRVLPFLWIVLAGLYFYYPDVSYLLAVLLGLSNFIITMKYAAVVSAVQHRLSNAAFHLDKYAAALSLIYKKKWRTTLISKQIEQSEEKDTRLNKINALINLKKISDLLDYRLHMIPSFILNVGMLWDSKICARLSLWHRDNKDNVLDIFNLIGRVEAITSLATWSYNYPDYCYPKVDDKYFHLEGEELRHPLLTLQECVPNDLEIKKGQYVGIITGSNMSGKSTFLRTIGLNIVLGNCGTRIAGTSLGYGLVELITYMRIKDALEENVSTFKSELNRVAKMLDMIGSDRPTFILADEILRGTNSHDKLKGSKAIVSKILYSKAYALVATHDISLAEMGARDSEISNYYFDIDYADGDLIFDYKIKKGICENFNASFLLGQLGLNVEDPL